MPIMNDVSMKLLIVSLHHTNLTTCMDLYQIA